MTATINAIFASIRQRGQRWLNRLVRPSGIWCEHIRWTDEPAQATAYGWWCEPKTGWPYTASNDWQYCPWCGAHRPNYGDHPHAKRVG